MSDQFPTRPADISLYLTLSELAERSAEHLTALLGPAPQQPDVVAAHAIAWLAYRTELANRAHHGRWVTAVDALSAGAGHKQTAAAMSLDVAQLRSGIAEWADGQLSERFITPQRYAEVLDLIGVVSGDE